MTKQVKLSNDQTIEVGQINWQGFKRLKALIAKTVSGPMLRETVDVISGPLGSIVGDLLKSIASAVKSGDGSTDAQAFLAAELTAKWGDAQTLSLVATALGNLKGSIAAILTDLLETSDEFTELLLISTTKDWDFRKLDQLPFEDVVSVRDAALEVNDLGKLFDLEKNWWGRVMSSGRACLGTPTSNSPGTSTTNTDSVPLTTGH